MKIVDRDTFIKMPANTVYSDYSPCYFGPLCINGGSIIFDSGNDYFYQQIVGAVDADDPGEFVDKLSVAEANGTNVGLDLYCESRDGYFEYDQLYAVWDKEDVAMLIERLKECL